MTEYGSSSIVGLWGLLVLVSLSTYVWRAGGVAIAVGLAGVRGELTVVRDIRYPIVVVVWITDVALSVAVVVLLTRVCGVRTVVCTVEHAVFVRILDLEGTNVAAGAGRSPQPPLVLCRSAGAGSKGDPVVGR